MKIIINQMMTVSSPPHIYGEDTIERRMRDVLIALSPAFVMGVYHFGPRALVICLISVLSALLAEFIFQKAAGKQSTINDYSAIITGVLLAFNLPPTVPFWIPVIGSFFAIIVVKQLFGGLGANFMNPALAARALLLVSFPVHMTNWVLPDAVGGSTVVAGATYLGILSQHPDFSPAAADYMALLFGKVGGCIGETSAIALIVGGIYLLIRRVINWRIPVFYIGSFAFFAFLFGRTGFFSAHVLFEVLAGGLLLGAFFMATDYATSPISPAGKIVMGIGCGFLTVMIRFYGGYPEGVSYAIIIMNLFVPLIDKYLRPRVYGKGKRSVA
jgi:electron transport complex protein RnfD